MILIAEPISELMLFVIMASMFMSGFAFAFGLYLKDKTKKMKNKDGVGW